MHRARCFFRGSAARWGGAAVAVAGLAAALLAPPSVAGASPARTVTTTPASAMVTSLTLATGDEVSRMVARDGRVAYALRNADPRMGYETLSFGGREDFVPGYAVRMLGRQVDASLFDVGALSSDGYGSAGSRIPVRVTFTPGARPAAPPGITLTRVTGDIGAGYVSSRVAFGAALRRQVAQELRHNWQAPLFADVQNIGFAGAIPAQSSEAPVMAGPAGGPFSGSGQQYVVRLTVTEPAGTAPYSGLVQLMSTDTTHSFYGQISVLNGVEQVALQAGTYEAEASIPAWDASGNITGLVYAVQDFTIRPGRSSDVRTVSLDLNDVSTPLSVQAPEEASGRTLSIGYHRHSAATTGPFAGIANSWTDAWTVPTGIPVQMTPQGRPDEGTRELTVGEQMTGVAAAHTVYNIGFTWNTLPQVPDYQATTASLAAVTDQVYDDPGSDHTGYYATMIDQPGLFFNFFFPSQITLPYQVTQYYSSGLLWDSYVLADYANSLSYWGNSVSYAPGQPVVNDWLHGPLTPGLLASASGCQACVAGNQLSFGIRGLIDSGQNTSYPQSATSELTVVQGGTTLFDQANARGFTGLTVPPGGGPITVSYQQQRTGSGFSQSASTDTTWVFADPATGSGYVLPAGTCPAEQAGSSCQQLPVLALRYDMATNLLNEGQPGTQGMNLTVAHVATGGIGSTSAIDSVDVEVSFDAGNTWTKASVTQGTGGHYSVTWQNPASAVGTSPSLRVTAADAAGNTLTQTTSAAYTITSAS